MSNEVEFEYTGIEKTEDVPRDVKVIRVDSSVTEIEENTFQGCEYLKKVVFKEGLRKIGKYSFYNCKSLESITFPSTVTEIDYVAFCGCDNLKDVVLNEGMREIAARVFHDCSSLEHIALPSTVTEIGRYTFFNCQRLREVELHEGIQMIGPEAFKNCSSLETFKFPNLSTRLETIIHARKYVDIEDKIDSIRGLVVERRGNELFVSDVESVTQRWRASKGTLDQIDRLLTYYELREATTLLELAMWKSKMDQAEENPFNRDVYRIDIPGPVKHIILQYLNFRV